MNLSISTALLIRVVDTPGIMLIKMAEAEISITPIPPGIVEIIPKIMDAVKTNPIIARETGIPKYWSKI